MHAHNAWLLFAIYTFAQLFALYYKAAKSAASKHSPWETVHEYFAAHAPDILLRWVIAVILFKALWDNPEFFLALAQRAGLGFDWPFALNDWTAALYGLASDKLADLALSAAGAFYRRLQGKVTA